MVEAPPPLPPPNVDEQWNAQMLKPPLPGDSIENFLPFVRPPLPPTELADEMDLDDDEAAPPPPPPPPSRIDPSVVSAMSRELLERLDELAALFEFDLGTPSDSSAAAAARPSSEPSIAAAAAPPGPRLLQLSEVMHRFVTNEFEQDGFESDPEDVVARPIDSVAGWAEAAAGEGPEYSPSSVPVDDFFEVRKWAWVGDGQEVLIPRRSLRSIPRIQILNDMLKNFSFLLWMPQCI